MSTAAENANLILKLFELRREEVMRNGRNFFFTFHPKSFEEVTSTMMGPQGNYLRMVLSYWDMAASLVVNGAIDAKMFDDANGEHFGVFAKIEPFVPQLRVVFQNPRFLQSLEQVCLGAPEGRQRVDRAREFQRQIQAMLAQSAAQA